MDRQLPALGGRAVGGEGEPVAADGHPVKVPAASEQLGEVDRAQHSQVVRVCSRPKCSIGRADDHHPPGADHLLSDRQQAVHVGDVLDQLEEHHGVIGALVEVAVGLLRGALDAVDPTRPAGLDVAGVKLHGVDLEGRVLLERPHLNKSLVGAERQDLHRDCSGGGWTWRLTILPEGSLTATL